MFQNNISNNLLEDNDNNILKQYSGNLLGKGLSLTSNDFSFMNNPLTQQLLNQNFMNKANGINLASQENLISVSKNNSSFNVNDNNNSSNLSSNNNVSPITHNNSNQNVIPETKGSSKRFMKAYEKSTNN